MKKKLHLKKQNNFMGILLLILFCFSGTSKAQQFIGGTLDGNFTNVVTGWTTADSGASASVSGGFWNMSMGLQSNGKYRGDIWYNLAGNSGNYITLNSTNDAYIAIKFKGARPSGALKFEMNRSTGPTTNAWDNTAWNSGSPDGSFTDSNGDKTYYFKLTNDADFAGGNLTYRMLHLIVADNPVTETSYKVDWIATFDSTAAIETYVTATTLGVNDYQVGNDVSIYPNPSNENSFNLDLGNLLSESNVNVKIYNLLGQLVLENNILPTSSTIQINHNLKTGLYLVMVNNKANIKLMVK